MTIPNVTSGATAAPHPDDVERLRKTGKQFEGVFVLQLFKAMRDTVPQDEGIVSSGAGGDMFTSMLDQKMADQLPAQWHHDLSDVMVAQLKNRLSPQQSPVAESPTLPRPKAPEIR